MTIHCRAKYPRKTGDRIVRCSLNVGHTGDHFEFGTGIDWPPHGPLPPEDERDAAVVATPGRHRAPDPDVDPVTRAVEALHAFTGGGKFDRPTALALLNCWAHRDTLTMTQKYEVVMVVTASAEVTR